jgi:hypothetical protein
MNPKVNPKAIISAIAVGLIAGATVIGCATNLTPAPTAQTVTGLEDAAADQSSGVRIVAQAANWPGQVDISREMTPVRVIITNNSGVPLRVHPDQFALVSPTGRQFEALPLQRIQGEVEYFRTPTGRRPDVNYLDLYESPETGRRFSPPGVSEGGKLASDRDYYYNYWRDVPLPTPEMQSNALAEGVLESGNRMEGWLYFEKVDNVDQVTLRSELVDDATGSRIGDIQIPFEYR